MSGKTNWMSELRYHPFLDQWVITATHRQDRTFLPPANYNPLAPTKPGGFPTEIPLESYDIVVFENKFPSLKIPADSVAVVGTQTMPVRPSSGVCEVICYSQNPEATFATMGLSQVRKLARVWKDRYEKLSALDSVQYVFIFENKGKEIGVTLTHPHGQIYAYPFIPPVMKTELEAEKKHFQINGRPLMQDLINFELKGDARVEPERGHAPCERVVWENETMVAFVPFFARYPYEVWITTKIHKRSLKDFNWKELDDLAEALLVVTKKYDALFGFSMPYIMSMHQEPAVAGYEYNWFHVEFFPPYRAQNKLKYLAGSEAGAGAYINDTLPEETAKTLRELEIGQFLT